MIYVLSGRFFMTVDYNILSGQFIPFVPSMSMLENAYDQSNKRQNVCHMNYIIRQSNNIARSLRVRDYGAVVFCVFCFRVCDLQL